MLVGAGSETSKLSRLPIMIILTLQRHLATSYWVVSIGSISFLAARAGARIDPILRTTLLPFLLL